MKKIHPYFLIVFSLFISAFCVFGLIAFWKDASCIRIIQGSLIAFLFPYAAITTKLEYHEDFLYVFAGWNKVKIFYDDIVKISGSGSPGLYWLESYDTRARKFILYYPLEHKKLRGFFEAVEIRNPDVEFKVGWYKNLSPSNRFKAAVRFVLFVLIVCAADFFLNLLKK